MPAGKHIEPYEAPMIHRYLKDTSVSRDNTHVMTLRDVTHVMLLT
jgi:hypothetical protein